MRWMAMGWLMIPALAGADDARTLLSRARALHEAGKYAEALKEANAAVQANPKLPEAYDLRGMLHFKLGNIQESLADFDEQIRLDPKSAAAHWRRGLTLYYAEKFADGVAQFVTSDQAEPEDVENAIWHFLCNARVVGIEKARAEFLKVKEDPRGELMMRIYDLFRGQAKPDDVLTLAEAGDLGPGERQVRRFYANYYVGMYYEAVGEKEKSLALIQKAVEKYPVRHYMMDVGKVHLKLRKGM
ncbi:MAG: tetratricopeptide repeat protein [Gemmataceae bacterium]|nr:tetratricopeptide repeat protein [Gemmataceae bacterium]